MHPFDPASDAVKDGADGIGDAAEEQQQKARQGQNLVCNGYKFSGSKIDRQFSFVNIACRLEENAFDAGIYPRRNSTSTQQRMEPHQEVVRQEPSEESSLSVGLLDLTTAHATDPEEEMLAKQYVKKKKKPQRKRGFRL